MVLATSYRAMDGGVAGEWADVTWRALATGAMGEKWGPGIYNAKGIAASAYRVSCSGAICTHFTAVILLKYIIEQQGDVLEKLLCRKMIEMMCPIFNDVPGFVRNSLMPPFYCFINKL